jgi:general secretion pathway protein F
VKRFAYKAVATDGQPIEGEMDAPDESAVIDQLQTSGYLPVSTNELPAPGLYRSLSIFSRDQVSHDDICNVTRELATMLNAGLPLAHALQTLTSLTTKPALHALLERIRSAVEGGATLSEAFEQAHGPFSNFYVGLIRAGEAAGALELVLHRLAEYQQRAKELNDTILSALLYPAILFLVSGSSLVVLLIYVVPQFQPLFEDLGKSLPWSTQIVVGLASILRGFWWTFPIVIAAAYAAWRALLADPDSQKKWDALVLRLPVFGDLLVRIEVARMCRTLGTLVSNGVTLLDGITLVRDTSSNLIIAGALDSVAKDLEHGRGLSQPMADANCFPQLAIELIRVGEETGALAQMLLKLADIYDAEVQSTVKRAIALLEPALILGMGLIIAFIIVSVLLAILGLNELVV